MRLTIASFNLVSQQESWIKDGPLFRSRKGHGQLSLSGASRLVKRWEKQFAFKRSLAVALRNNGRQGLEYALNFSGRGKKRLPTTLHGDLYKRLFEAIVRHELPPGEQLIIDKIREKFGASQTSIREALQRLQALGFVVKNRNKLFTTPLSKKDFRDIVEARVQLECKLAEEAVPNISRSVISKLEKLHIDFVAQWDGRREGLFPAYDRQFHLSIYKAADKPIFFQMVEWLWQRSCPYLHLIEHNYILENCAPAHERVLIGLKNRDANAVSDAIRDNIVHGFEDLYGYFN